MTIANWWSAPIAPLYFNGEISPMYSGTRPDDRPAAHISHLPNIRVHSQITEACETLFVLLVGNLILQTKLH